MPTAPTEPPPSGVKRASVPAQREKAPSFAEVDDVTADLSRDVRRDK
jgi:hypothetical protein